MANESDFSHILQLCQVGSRGKSTDASQRRRPSGCGGRRVRPQLATACWCRGRRRPVRHHWIEVPSSLGSGVVRGVLARDNQPWNSASLVKRRAADCRRFARVTAVVCSCYGGCAFIRVIKIALDGGETGARVHHARFCVTLRTSNGLSLRGCFTALASPVRDWGDEACEEVSRRLDLLRIAPARPALPRKLRCNTYVSCHDA